MMNKQKFTIPPPCEVIYRTSKRNTSFMVHLDPPMLQAIPYGLVVRIRRSHRRGPGSIPGVGRSHIFSFYSQNRPKIKTT